MEERSSGDELWTRSSIPLIDMVGEILTTMGDAKRTKAV